MVLWGIAKIPSLEETWTMSTPSPYGPRNTTIWWNSTKGHSEKPINLVGNKFIIYRAMDEGLEAESSHSGKSAPTRNDSFPVVV